MSIQKSAYSKNPSKIEVDIKIFSDEEKLKEFFFSRLALFKKKKQTKTQRIFIRLAGPSSGRNRFPKDADMETMSSKFYAMENSSKNVPKSNSKGLRLAVLDLQRRRRGQGASLWLLMDPCHLFRKCFWVHLLVKSVALLRSSNLWTRVFVTRCWGEGLAQRVIEGRAQANGLRGIKLK